jgi:septum site-determining protein MinC
MLVDNKSSVQIKGIKEGLLVTLGEGEWSVLRIQLLDYVADQVDFFKGARVALDIGNHILHAAELGSLRDKLSEQGITLWAILSNSPTTEQTAQMLGMATRLSKPRPERVTRRGEATPEGEECLFINKTLRSGFRVEQAGHVVVLGDVNPGAEIIAEGNIVIWGRLRGTVQAGVKGDENAVVCALEMTPTQMRIANVVAAIGTRKGKLTPEIAFLKEKQIIFQSWNMKAGGR